jgi:metallophosphoesterase (TIGR00282 family)
MLARVDAPLTDEDPLPYGNGQSPAAACAGGWATDGHAPGLARVLFVGDVVGPLGLATVEALLPELRVAHSIDLCVANGENAIDSGAGLDRACAERLLAAGVDAITTGNHAYDAPGAIDLHASELPVVRPQNLAGPGCGRESVVVERDGLRLGVVNVIGAPEGAAPSPACEDARRAVAGLAADADLILVDVHASWPAEKLAVAWVLDGQVCAVVGTHTHVPTADARVLPGGTAYVSDVGMTGARDSLIGFRPEDVVRQIRQAGSPLPAPESSGEGVLMGVLITATIDGRAVGIEPVSAATGSRIGVGV